MIVIYSRFSPRRNADEALSCDTQEAMCHTHAVTLGIPVRSVHRDENLSGDVVDRPGLAAAIGDLRQGDVLLVYRRDRLARDGFLAELIRRQVAAARAKIVAVDGDPVAGDDVSPEAVFVRQVLDAVAELERKLIGARTRVAMRTQQRQGKRVGRYAPYGFRIDPKDATRLVPCPKEEQAVARVLELAATGLSPWKIARKMTAEMPEAARGAAWTARTVEKIARRK